jgi:hypothetical protein
VGNKDASYASCPLLRKFVRLLVLTLLSPTEILLSYPPHTAAGEVVAAERRPVPLSYCGSMACCFCCRVLLEPQPVKNP